MFLQSSSPFKKDESGKVAPVVITDENNMAINGVEAQTLVLTKSPLPVNRQCCKFSLNINITVLIYVAVVILSVCAIMLVPLFLEVTRIQNISKSGIFGDALRISTRLMIMESISIGCTLPILSDVFLDRFTSNNKKAKMTLSMWHIILFLLAFTMAGILHISLSDCYFMAYLHIVLTHSKVIVIGAVTFYTTVSSGIITNSAKSKILLLTPVPIYAVRFVFETTA